MASPLLNYDELKKKRDAAQSATQAVASARARELVEATMRAADQYVTTLEVDKVGTWYVPVGFDFTQESLDVQTHFKLGVQGYGFYFRSYVAERVGFDDRLNRFILLDPLTLIISRFSAQYRTLWQTEFPEYLLSAIELQSGGGSDADGKFPRFLDVALLDSKTREPLVKLPDCTDVAAVVLMATLAAVRLRKQAATAATANE